MMAFGWCIRIENRTCEQLHFNSYRTFQHRCRKKITGNVTIESINDYCVYGAHSTSTSLSVYRSVSFLAIERMNERTNEFIFSYVLYNRVINLLLFDWLLHMRNGISFGFCQRTIGFCRRNDWAVEIGAVFFGNGWQKVNGAKTEQKKNCNYTSVSCNEMKLSTKIFYK